MRNKEKGKTLREREVIISMKVREETKWRDKGKYCLHQGIGLLISGYTGCVKLNEF